MRSLKEKFWYLNYVIFAKSLPVSYHFPPAKVARVFFARRIIKYVGKGINIEKGAVFNGQVSIGNYSGIGVKCELYGPVIIGEHVMMGPEVIIYTQNHAYEKAEILIQRQGYKEYKPVRIGNDVWIGRRVIILPGVNIGDGCIIGAGSVVTKDIPPYSVVVGNPGFVIKSRKGIRIYE